MCLLDRIEILALEVLDECHLCHFRVVCCAEKCRNGREPCHLGGAQTPLARNELVLARADVADGDGLEDAVLCNGLAQLLQCRLVELAARLKAVGLDHGNGELRRDARGGCSGLCLFLRRRVGRQGECVFSESECAEPTSEPACFSLLHAV